MKKILFVNDEQMMGGVAILLEDILKKICDLKNTKIDLLILHKNGDRLQNLPPNINIIYGTPFFEMIDIPLKQAIRSKKITKIMKKVYLIFLLKTGLIQKKIKHERKKMHLQAYDTEIAFKDGFCGIFVATGESKTKIQWLHSDYAKKDYLQNYRKLFLKLFQKFDTFVAVSSPVANHFNDIYEQKDKTLVIENYIDTEKIKKMAASTHTIELPKDKINLITIGRLHYDKGIHNVLEVLNRLNIENMLNHVHYTIIGDGPEQENLKAKTKEFHLESKVTMLGKQNNPFTILKQSDLFILSSIHESFGLVVIEALTLQIPVLATDVASIHELLNEKYGKIVSNQEDLYYNIKEVIQNKEKLSIWKQNLKTYQYQNEEIIQKIKKLLS